MHQVGELAQKVLKILKIYKIYTSQPSFKFDLRNVPRSCVLHLISETFCVSVDAYLNVTLQEQN